MEFNMFKKIAKFFMPYQKVEVTSNLKMVEEPVKEEVIQSAEVIKGPVKCGCGRSPTGNCVGLHKLTEAEWAAHPDNKKPDANWPFPTAVGTEEKKPAVKAKAARAKKAPVAAMTAAEKPAKEKKPARPRAPKAPKA